MRVAYFGTAVFAVPALRAVADHVVLVVSQPDRPTGRGLQTQPSPVKLAALEHGLPVETPEKCRTPEFVEFLRSLELDVLLVAAYGQILSVAVLESAHRGGINLHGSVLPHYRGAAPIQRAILAGERQTGITLIQMDKGMDSGDCIAIEHTPIGEDETYGELQDRLAAIAAEMAGTWLPRIVAGDYPRVPQDHDHATFAPKVLKEEAELRFERAAPDEYNRFRAFTPAPGPFLSLPAGPMRIRQARLDSREGEPGTLLALDPDPIVAFSVGSLRLIEVQPAGKRAMAGRDWVNGARLALGERIPV
ncbi:MAG TPA: methionyl-tRNA formyltransferase [Fimbriimonadaceae bacterium]|nr:methionyl-tRNA formyltransferase [Fimbriimonadaceae bacterium]